MKVVFDASALLILLNRERGYEFVESYIANAIMSTVNVAEVITVLVGVGVPQADAVVFTTELISEIIPFDVQHAAITAELRPLTKPYGLSLGDRACLALAQNKKLPVLTADKIWKELKLPFEVLLAR